MIGGLATSGMAIAFVQNPFGACPQFTHTGLLTLWRAASIHRYPSHRRGTNQIRPARGLLKSHFTRGASAMVDPFRVLSVDFIFPSFSKLSGDFDF